MSQPDLFSHPSRPDRLDQAKDKIRQQGGTCPCCGQSVATYKRTLHAQMAAWLCVLVRLSGPDCQWVGVDAVAALAPTRGGDYGKLVFWGLCEQAEKDPEDKSRRTSGRWRPTELGCEWVAGRVTVPRYARIRLGVLVDLQGPAWGVAQALGKRFNYDELMGGV